METYQNYRDYGITYYTFSGTTYVDTNGTVIRQFVGLGEIEGEKQAKKFIDDKYE